MLPSRPAAQAAWSVRRRPCAKRSSIARLNAGRSAGFRLETRLPSTTTSSSTHSAPAFRRSVFNDGHAAMRRPLAAPASMTIQGPWQTAATGLSASKKAFTNSTAFGCMRSASGFITPPGRRRASKSRACARFKATSTRTSLPHLPWWKPRTHSSLGDTTLVTAPALSSAERGSLNSDGSKPSVTRIATLTFARLSIVLLLGSMTTRPKGATVMTREENGRWWEPALYGDHHERQGGRYDREETD